MAFNFLIVVSKSPAVASEFLDPPPAPTEFQVYRHYDDIHDFEKSIVLPVSRARILDIILRFLMFWKTEPLSLSPCA